MSSDSYDLNGTDREILALLRAEDSRQRRLTQRLWRRDRWLVAYLYAGPLIQAALIAVLFALLSDGVWPLPGTLGESLGPWATAGLLAALLGGLAVSLYLRALAARRRASRRLDRTLAESRRTAEGYRDILESAEFEAFLRERRGASGAGRSRHDPSGAASRWSTSPWPPPLWASSFTRPSTRPIAGRSWGRSWFSS